ncbi:MAG: TonB family protein [Methyloceanibacter sp.]
MTHKDRPKLALFVLAAGAILLGAAALQSVLIVGPGPGSSSPHTISVDTSGPAATPAPASTPRPWNSPSPAVEVAPAEPSDHDLAHPASPRESTSDGSAPSARAPAPEKAAKPKVETPPAQSKPAPQPEPSPIAMGEPEERSAPAAKVETPPVELKPSPALVQAPPAPENKPAIAAEPKVETPPSEVKPAPKPEPTQIAKSAPEEAKPEPVPAVAPKSEVKEAAADVKPLKQKRAPETKIIATEAKPEPAQPKTAPVKKPKQTVTAAAQTKITAKPMSLGFGRAAAAHPASKVTSGHYAASVRAAIGRHRPAARGGGRATVAFSIGPAGGLQGVRIARSSGKAKLDQAAIATVQSAAPFPPPPAGVNPTFSIQIYFH